MWVRLFRSHGATAEELRRALDEYAEKDLPRISAAPGFLGATLGDGGPHESMVSLTYWESETEMLAAERLSVEARHRALPALDADRPLLVARYEVAFASQFDLSDETTHMLVVRFPKLTYASMKTAEASNRADAEKHLPSIEGIDGVVIARASTQDELLVASYWRSQASMRAAAQVNDEVTGRAAAAAKARRDPHVDMLGITIAKDLDRLTGRASAVGTEG